MASHEIEMQIYAPAEVVLTVEADAGVVVNSLTRKFDDDHQPQRRQPCTIYKVLERIRSDDPRAYNPQLISIGPYHHGNELLLPMERIKRQFFWNLIGRHPSNSLPSYTRALSSANSVRKSSIYYSDYVLGSDDVNTFVEMMVLDGCFIIEFLVRSISAEDMGELDFVSWNRSLVENDLQLLENQVPFSVLESLFDSSVIPGMTDTPKPITLKELASSCFSRDVLNNGKPIPPDIYHLLHLRHSLLAPTAKSAQDAPTKSCSFMSVMRMTINKIKDGLLYSFFLLSSVLLSCCRPPPAEPSTRSATELNEPGPIRAPRSIPSATELNEAGIEFQLKNQCPMLDVTFSKKDGIMQIPLLSIQAVTVSQFRNLVAFEQCCPKAGSHFTSYVALMDNLIDTPKDVALLEYSGVLESKLGSDEEVCQLFNNLGKGAFLNYKEHNLKDLFQDVKEYCGTDRHRWRARMVRDYFSNPWSAISLFAAFVLLMLTVLQTFFAVYAYFRPPPSASAPAPA